jgi:hypothetical protein
MADKKYDGIFYISQRRLKKAICKKLSEIVGFGVNRRTKPFGSEHIEGNNVITLNRVCPEEESPSEYMVELVQTAVEKYGVPRAIVLTDGPFKDSEVNEAIKNYASGLGVKVHYFPREILVSRISRGNRSFSSQ